MSGFIPRSMLPSLSHTERQRRRPPLLEGWQHRMPARSEPVAGTQREPTSGAASVEQPSRCCTSKEKTLWCQPNMCQQGNHAGQCQCQPDLFRRVFVATPRGCYACDEF